MHPYFSLEGRTALVTGGSRGIGRMIAQGFLEAGARVFICARHAEDCAITAKELSRYGDCIGLAADLSSEEGAKALARFLPKSCGRMTCTGANPDRPHPRQAIFAHTEDTIE